MSGLTENQKTRIVDRTNFYRSRVLPAASNLRRISWDDELANVAQNYADKCIFEHNPKRKHSSFSELIGENLLLVFPNDGGFLFNSTMLDIADYAVKSWFDERVDYDYDRNGFILQNIKKNPKKM
jgi:uncharacterized protein YkwD